MHVFIGKKKYLYPLRKLQEELKNTHNVSMEIIRALPDHDEVAADDAPILNWGRNIPRWYLSPFPMLNRYVSASKTKYLQAIKETFFSYPEGNYKAVGVSCTRAPAIAIRWCKEGHLVFRRDSDTGYGGKDITVCRTPEDIIEGLQLNGLPVFWSKGVRGDEYRAYFVKDLRTLKYHVYRVVKKTERPQKTITDYHIKSNKNGWVFRYANPAWKKSLEEQTHVFNEYHFGALDLIDRGDRLVILELNSAPGMKGSTVKNTAAAFVKHWYLKENHEKGDDYD